MRFMPHNANNLCAAAVVFCGVFANIPAVAATIEVFEDPVMRCDIRISGVINDGDSDRLKAILEGRGGALFSYVGGEDDEAVGRVCFNSPGGSLREGIRIGRVIRESGLGTAVGENAVCESACALAFMAGSQYVRGSRQMMPDRHIHSSARLGFHAPAIVVPHGSFDSEDIQHAFNISLLTVSEVLNLYGVGSPHHFPYGWFLETPHEEMRLVETVGEALLLGVNVIDLPFPSAASISVIQRACESHLSISRIHELESRGEQGSEFVWRGFRDVESLRQSLFPFSQRSNPFELWELTRSSQERHRPMISRVPSSGVTESFEIGLPMEDAGGGERGQSFSSCELRFFINEQGQDNEQNSGILGYIEYLSNASLGENSYISRLLAGHLHDPSTRLRDITTNGELGMSFRDWIGLLEEDVVQVVNSVVNSKPSFSCWLTSPTARVHNVNEYVNLRRQPDFSARVIRQVPLGEQVRPLRFDNLSVIGQERDRQSCINACQAFGANSEDRSARDRVQQCIDDNMLWYEITDARGNRGWVSRKFLEEVE
jgi:hypothetical protein